MTPENIGLGTGSYIRDAGLIKDRLMVVQNKMHKAATEVMEEELDGIDLDTPEDIGTTNLIDTRIEKKSTRIAPELIARALPLSIKSAETTSNARINIESILSGKDGRIFVIVGPCSIHDPEAAIEYARQVKKWREQYGDNLEIIMRMYPEKPRTELKENSLDSWKGLSSDPLLDGSNDLNLGVIITRKLARDITGIGVPVATEALDPTTPQYYDGLITYYSIGARNTPNQNARMFGSGTSAIIAFKNSVDGNIDTAVEAVASANVRNTFPGTSMEGYPMEVWTRGNNTAHVILRGGLDGPNYSNKNVRSTAEKLAAKELLQSIVIDANHGNSGKDASKQIEVIQNVCMQLIVLGEIAIKGAMIESNLVGGSQKINGSSELVYGQSITDECVGLKETHSMLKLLYGAVMTRKSHLPIR